MDSKRCWLVVAAVVAVSALTVVGSAGAEAPGCKTAKGSILVVADTEHPDLGTGWIDGSVKGDVKITYANPPEAYPFGYLIEVTLRDGTVLSGGMQFIGENFTTDMCIAGGVLTLSAPDGREWYTSIMATVRPWQENLDAGGLVFNYTGVVCSP